MIPAYMNWSGGKDSSLCLYRVRQEQKYQVTGLLTSVNATHNRISMHGVRRELLEAQARELGLPLSTIELPEQPDMQDYEAAMRKAVTRQKAAGNTHAIFGDIFLEDLKLYREQQLQQLDLQCAFPLWQQPTHELVKEFIDRGFKAYIVCINEAYLDPSFCGRLIDAQFLDELPANVDPCGENGEFHSFVFDGPVFNNPIQVQKGAVVRRTYNNPGNRSDDHTANTSQYGFYFCDLLLNL